MRQIAKEKLHQIILVGSCEQKYANLQVLLCVNTLLIRVPWLGSYILHLFIYKQTGHVLCMLYYSRIKLAVKYVVLYPY